MRDRFGRIGILAVVAVLAGAPSNAQSLGDLAHKEKEKREAARSAANPPKVYGEKDLATYADERPPEDVSAEGSSTTPAMSATPKASAAKKPAGSPAPTAEEGTAPERREAEDRKAEDRKAEAEQLRARWREAQQRLASAEQRLAASEAELKALPPGLPAGNYYDDIQAAVEQQKVEREQRNILAKKALAAAKEALDAVETEARRKQIRLD